MAKGLVPLALKVYQFKDACGGGEAARSAAKGLAGGE